MNSLFPSIVSRSQSSGLMNFFVPIISVIYDGNLSKPFKTSEIEIEKLGLLMGGKNE